MADSLEYLAELWKKGVISGDEYVVRKYQLAQSEPIIPTVTVSAATVGVVKFGKMAWGATFAGVAAVGAFVAMAVAGGGESTSSSTEQRVRHEVAGNGGPRLDGVPRIVLSEHTLAVTRGAYRQRSASQADDCPALPAGAKRDPAMDARCGN